MSCLGSDFVGCGIADFEFVSSLIGSRFPWNDRFDDWTCEDVRERELGFEGNGWFDDTFGNLKTWKENFYFSIQLLIRH